LFITTCIEKHCTRPLNPLGHAADNMLYWEGFGLQLLRPKIFYVSVLA